MLAALAAPECDRNLRDSLFHSPLLVDAFISNSYPGWKEGSQASCRYIFCLSAVRFSNASPPPLSNFL